MTSPASCLGDLVTPCLVVDLGVVHANCQRMLKRCETLGVQLRPHMKTHKTLEAGAIMTGGTKRRVAVATLAEAEFFADGGFEDIAFVSVVGKDKIPRLRALAERLDNFHVMVDSDAQRLFLEACPLAGGKQWSLFVKVDSGNRRAGIDWTKSAIRDLVRKIAESEVMTFHGLYVHEGHSYNQQGDAVSEMSNESVERLLAAKQMLQSLGLDRTVLSVGATPTCSRPGDKMGQVTEMHPGNYVFYDVQQLLIGSCEEADIACKVMTRILSHYPDRNEMLVDCGFLGLSQDGKGALANGSWCMIQGHPNLSLFKMSQEYGLIKTTDGSQLDFERFPLGSRLFLLPHHACATAAMHASYYVHQGEDIVELWKPCRGW